MEAMSANGGTDAAGGTNRDRSFDFNTFASELFNSITIRKTSAAELEEGSLAAALILADSLELKSRLIEIARKELRLTKRQLDKIDAEKEKLVKTAAKELKRTP
jgi:hypothetical protein